MEMERWQLTLMIVVLLTLTLTSHMGFVGLFVVPIIWLVGQKVATSAAQEGRLKATARFAIAGLAAVGLQAVCFRVLPSGMIGVILPLAPPFLLIYWLEEIYAVVPMGGVTRTILRAVVSLILARFVAVAIGIVIYIATGIGIYFVWTGLVLLCLIWLSFVLSFYDTWKLLPQNDHR